MQLFGLPPLSFSFLRFGVSHYSFTSTPALHSQQLRTFEFDKHLYGGLNIHIRQETTFMRARQKNRYSDVPSFSLYYICATRLDSNYGRRNNAWFGYDERDKIELWYRVRCHDQAGPNHVEGLGWKDLEGIITVKVGHKGERLFRVFLRHRTIRTDRQGTTSQSDTFK
ncbi:hypothetical protein BKA69DRAFT_813339 [Paraphysoderma sedebokerense]|nr:hypothetical protein BKA69DRAFT_813339 [Paraphysoderma sedebokerense]